MYAFGPFEMDPAEQRLSRDGQPIPLTPKAFQTLLALVRRAGHLVEKDALIAEIWPDTSVEEIGLTRNISVLRKALGDGIGEDERYIETVPKRGYRFVAPVTAIGAAPAAAVPSDPDSRLERPQHLSSEWHGERKWRRLSASAAIVGLAAAVYVVPQRARTSASPTSVRSLAILPLATIGPETDESLGQGIADALIIRVSGLGQIAVRPTRAVLEYTSPEPDAAAVGRRLEVDAVMTGTIQQSGERIRVTVQLVDSVNGHVLWAEAVENRATGIFDVENSISAGIADALLLKLNEAQRRRLAKQNTSNAEAYRAYVRGRYFFNRRTQESLEKSVAEYRRTISIDPTYAAAYAGMADTYDVGADWLLPRADAHRLAYAAATKALELDDTLAEAHAALGQNAMLGRLDWREAERELRRAIELNPGYAQAYYVLGTLLMCTGRTADAAQAFARAVELDPLAVHFNNRLAQALIGSGRVDEGIARCRRTIASDPGDESPHLILSLAYLEKQMIQAALEEATIAYSRNRDEADYAAQLGFLYGRLGNATGVREMLERLNELQARNYVSPLAFASVHAGNGDTDRALDFVERALTERDERLVTLKSDELLSSLRGNPRYDRALQQVGLAP